MLLTLTMIIGGPKSNWYNILFKLQLAIFVDNFISLHVHKLFVQQNECIGKDKVKLSYSKITEYGISFEGLLEDVILKHPSS